MTQISRMSACALMLLFTQCQSETDDAASLSRAVGPQDVDGRPPDCGQDGICRINECDDDPDCDDPSEAQSGAQSGPAAVGATPGVIAGTPGAVSATWSLTGPVTPTLISGFSGTSQSTLGTPGSSTKGAYALLSRERSDDPCHLALGTEDIDTATIDSVPILDFCGPNGPTSSTLHADYLDPNAGGVDEHTFISGVSVCMDSGNDKVKGISVVGKILTSAGSLVPVAQSWGSRTNCHHWEAWRHCPVGQIATAVDAHFVPENGGRRSLVGLALHCRAVMP